MIHLILHVLRSTALLAAVLGAAAGYGAMTLSLLYLPGLTRREAWVFASGIGMGFLSIGVLMLGALGMLYPATVMLLLVVGMILLAWRREVLLAAYSERPATQTGASLTGRILSLGLLLLIGLALGYSLFTHALVPPVDYDVLAYHFAIPKLYIEAHSLIYIPYILHSNWPLGTEMLFLIGLILQSETLAQLITWSFAVLLCAAVLLFGERWLPALTGWIATAALCSVPMLTSLAGTGMVEVPLTCFTFLAFYALWNWHTNQARGWLVLSALLAGCAAATKLNGASAAIIFAAIAFWLALSSAGAGSAVRAFVFYGLVSLLVVLPWYLKTWAFTGNPIWPFLYPLLGGSNWDDLGSANLISYLRITNMPATFANWLTGLWQVTVANGRFGSFLLGPYLLALMPFGLLPTMRRSDLRNLLVVLLLVIFASYTIWFLLTHQTRFLMSTIPFALLFGATGLAWLWQNIHRSVSVVLQVSVFAWFLAGSWVFDEHHRNLWQRSQPYLLGQVDRETFLTGIYGDYPGFSYINRELPSTARVLLAPYEARGYFIDRPYLWANAIGQRYLRIEQMADGEELLADLRRRGVTHVLMNTRFIFEEIAYWDKINALLNDLVDQHGRLLFESGQSRIYVLDSSLSNAVPAD